MHLVCLGDSSVFQAREHFFFPISSICAQDLLDTAYTAVYPCILGPTVAMPESVTERLYTAWSIVTEASIGGHHIVRLFIDILAVHCGPACIIQSFTVPKA
jgi:hypothetical protein